MKLRQKEFCHNCNLYVIYEFEDITERQIIYCPNCNHQHYREIDEGTLVNIRLYPGQRTVEVVEMPPLSLHVSDADVAMPLNLRRKTLTVLGENDKGVIVQERVSGGTKINVMTDRRWGRDPSQM